MTVHTVRFPVSGLAVDGRELRARIAAASLARGPGLAAMTRTGESGRDVVIGYEVPLASVPISDPVVAGDPVALAREIFAALAGLHALELSAGALTPEHVLISPDARMWLVAWGIDRYDPTRDVAAAAALVVAWAVGDALEPALAAVLTVAGSADQHQRPSAAEVAQLLNGIPGGALRVEHVVPRPAVVVEPAGGQRVWHCDSATVTAPESTLTGEASAHTTVQQWRSRQARSDSSEGGSAERRGSRRPERAHRHERSQRPSQLLVGAVLAVISAVGLVSWARATAEAERGEPLAAASIAPLEGAGTTTSTTSVSAPESTSDVSNPAGMTISVTAPPDPNVVDASAPSPSQGATGDLLSTAGLPAAGSSAAVSADQPTQSTQDTDWTAVIRELDRLRGRAFASPGTSTLLDYAVPGQAVWVADQAALAALATTGQRIRGLTSKVLDVRPIAATTVARDSAATTLRVTDIRSSYEVLSSDGAVVSTMPPSTKTIWRVSLALTQGRWLIRSVERA